MAKFDVAVIGSGIYGLLTALKLEEKGVRVIMLDKFAPRHGGAASSGLTRAAHSLYDDTVYTELAIRSLHAYRDLCPDAVADCHAVLFAETKDKNTHASKVIKANFINHLPFDEKSVSKEYPLFKADYGCRDVLGGVFRMEIIRDHLLSRLRESCIQCAFNVDIEKIRPRDTVYDIHYGSGQLATVKKIVIAAGCGSQEVVDICDGISGLDLTLDMVKPGTLVHFRPKNEQQAEQASYRNMPAFAYIERGVFGLLMIDGYTDSVKIAGFFDPAAESRVGEETMPFLATHIPFLLDFEIIEPRIKDECSYDYTKDGHFIVGPLEEHPNIVLACGWNGGGYKFAPSVTGMMVRYLTVGENIIPAQFSPIRLPTKKEGQQVA